MYPHSIHIYMAMGVFHNVFSNILTQILSLSHYFFSLLILESIKQGARGKTSSLKGQNESKQSKYVLCFPEKRVTKEVGFLLICDIRNTTRKVTSFRS